MWRKNWYTSNSVIAIIASLLLAGCTSYTTTPLTRLEDHSFASQSDGKPGYWGQARPFKGIPVTLQVPTHLDVYIEEIYFVKLEETVARQVPEGTRLLQVRTEVIESGKVFIVDFKRPAAGFLDLELTFDQDRQYFQKIVSELQDDTISDTAGLIAQSIRTISGVMAVDDPSLKVLDDRLRRHGIEREQRVVAFRRFDLDSPTFLWDVDDFVQRHLNDCSACGLALNYDGKGSAAEIERLHPLPVESIPREFETGDNRWEPPPLD